MSHANTCVIFDEHNNKTQFSGHFYLLTFCWNYIIEGLYRDYLFVCFKYLFYTALFQYNSKSIYFSFSGPFSFLSMFLWLTMDYSIKPSHCSNRVLSVSQGHGSDRTAGKRTFSSRVSVWTSNLCVLGLTLYPLRYLRYLMIQQPSAELLLHLLSPVWLSVWWTVMRVDYLV